MSKMTAFDMNRVAQDARQATNVSDKLPHVKVESQSASTERQEIPHKSRWTPPGLHPMILALTIAICWAFIAVLQVFLLNSERDGGVLFAPKISELPFGQQFLYLYLPTVIAVLFSIYWAWIDLETKRMEPYYQLSKPNGALGKDSLLLHYPFDFIPLVPIKAAKDRHWPVFWGSFAVLLVTFGLVPVQAGMFSVQSIVRVSDIPFMLSTSFMPADEQPRNLSMRFAQSAYGIVSLNETLPGFMARNYTLAPFSPAISQKVSPDTQSTWTATTTMYSLDMFCEIATVVEQRNNALISVWYNSTGGCSFTLGLTGNLTKGANRNNFYSPLLDMKEYTAMYVPYWNNGFADWYLDGSCPSSQNATFYAAFAKNKEREEDPPNPVTAVFCWPSYYQQEVIATVDALTQAPLNVTRTGSKQPLERDIFNQTTFEQQLGSGATEVQVRRDNLPGNGMPDYLEKIAESQVSFQTGSRGGGLVQPMVGLALAVEHRPLEDYLNWTALSKSYADAYRLLFARAMVDILDDTSGSRLAMTGSQRYTTQAVTMEPVFTYIVEGLLGAISVATLMLLYLSITRKRALRTDPSTIASVMALVADNDALLANLENLDCCTHKEMQSALGEKRFRLVDDGHHNFIELVSPAADALSPQLISPIQHRAGLRDIDKPIRPKEFSLWMSIPFVSLFLGLAIALAVIFARAQADGLPLPSTNKLVQNLLENYIPTALATLIEPMWVLTNRLLCMLQPIEQLRSCKAEARDSIDADYSSLPPQLTLFKALRSKHFVLAAVCAMALLANLLAIAFAGIFNQDSNVMVHSTVFNPPFEMKFVSINGSIGPKALEPLGSYEASGAFRGGNSEDQFLVAESNFTRGTPLPAWTDATMFYLPYKTSATLNYTTEGHYRANTVAFGARLDCELLKADLDYQGRIVNGRSEPLVEFNVTASSNSSVICPGNTSVSMHFGPKYVEGPQASNASCQRGPSAAEVMIYLTADTNATQAEKDACMSTVVMGWIRAPQGTCGTFEEFDLTDSNAAFARCEPKLLTGRASVDVDADGRLQEPVKDLQTQDLPEDSAHMFTNNPINLLGQSNKYFFKYGVGQSTWHNDSRAGDYMNYFALREGNSSRLVDPSQGPPTLDDIHSHLSKAYSRIFAIWLGTNKEKLLIPRAAEDQAPVNGWTVVTEQRLFLSTPMFVISEVILFTYVLVAIVVYLRRPGRYLAQMPTSVASVISLFAASAAVQDMKGTSYLDQKGRAKHLEGLGSRYGYGSYVGGRDGRVHIGIEKTPFVTLRPQPTRFDRKMRTSRKGSAVDA